MLSAGAFQTRRRRGAAIANTRSGAAQWSLLVRCEGALLYPLNPNPVR
jgi:hypothetical protein